jgi:hypothetical protein
MRLSDLVAHAERSETVAGAGSATTVETTEIIHRSDKRIVDPAQSENEVALQELTGLGPDVVISAIESAYDIFDLIDDELLKRGSPPLFGLVELANLASMVGNILCAGVATASAGAYLRNGPHAFPDLVPQYDHLPELEIKTALEKRRPKGHLPKPGTYMTFRYVLADRRGKYERGSRGDTVWVWEVRVGALNEQDFDLSNTPGDSGKTAVISAVAFKNMTRVFYAPSLLPYAQRNSPFGDPLPVLPL